MLDVGAVPCTHCAPIVLQRRHHRHHGRRSANQSRQRVDYNNDSGRQHRHVTHGGELHGSSEIGVVAEEIETD